MKSISSRFLILFFLVNVIPADTNGLHIHHSPKYKKLAQTTEESANRVIEELQPIFGNPANSIDIHLVSNQEDLRNLVGYGMPDWVSGVTLPNYQTIVMKTPDFNNSNMDNYLLTLRHELVHCLQGQQVPLNLMPTWFNEGMAMYFTHEFNIKSRILLSSAIVKKRLLELDDISGMVGFHEQKARLAYAESASVIEFLVLVYGRETITELLQLVKKNRDFLKSLTFLTGIEPDNFEYNWKQFIRHRYKYIFLLDIPTILWLIMPLLLVLGFVAKKIHNRKTLKQWDFDEEQETEDITP